MQYSSSGETSTHHSQTEECARWPFSNSPGIYAPVYGSTTLNAKHLSRYFFLHNFFFLIFFLGLPPRGRDLQGNQQAEDGKFFLNVKNYLDFHVVFLGLQHRALDHVLDPQNRYRNQEMNQHAGYGKL